MPANLPVTPHAPCASPGYLGVEPAAVEASGAADGLAADLSPLPMTALADALAPLPIAPPAAFADDLLPAPLAGVFFGALGRLAALAFLTPWDLDDWVKAEFEFASAAGSALAVDGANAPAANSAASEISTICRETCFITVLVFAILECEQPSCAARHRLGIPPKELQAQAPRAPAGAHSSRAALAPPRTPPRPPQPHPGRWSDPPLPAAAPADRTWHQSSCRSPGAAAPRFAP